jgi:membrane protease YdiL (CAAX protease family)
VLVLASHLPGADPFALPQQRPVLWLAILVLYPLLSALPQELIFRVFLFHRYRTLFPDGRTLPLVSAGVFALAHLVLGNWVALLLSLAGGLLFAYTYARTGSLGLVTLEHGLWGNWLFTVGMGSYFYGGHV